jgi:hypothetical protein
VKDADWTGQMRLLSLKIPNSTPWQFRSTSGTFALSFRVNRHS